MGSVAALLWAVAPVQAADLAAARSLYASASYEEALNTLASLNQNEEVEQLNQIRALCLLALGRTGDAEQAITRIVLHNPAYRIEQAEVSPKLVSLFHEVRRQKLPEAARALYASAKTRYDNQQFLEARVQFASLLSLLKDPDAAAQLSALADLRQLGEGFLRLSEAEAVADERRAADALAAKARADEAVRAAAAAAAEQAAAAGSAATPPPPSPPVPDEPATPAVFTSDDRDVVPPVEIRRVMPRWVPPTRAMAQTAHSGLLVLVIDDKGSVAEATLSKPISPAYDQALKNLALTWRYRPATKSGKPVRYRQILEIVLRPLQ